MKLLFPTISYSSQTDPETKRNERLNMSVFENYFSVYT